ncbi:MAG: cytochrome c [Acidobacteriota bacterium]
MKIPVPLQLAVLTVLMTGFYMMVGQAVPQKEVQPPEVIEIASDVSTAEMVEIGQEIYLGKGICSTCHTIGKTGALRFPDLDGIAARAGERRRAEGYTAVDYLAESLYEPDIFLVEGFNPGMPAIGKPPIGLTDQEILAVIAYLQTLGGTATVTMDTKLVYTGGALGGGAAPAADGDAETAVAAEAAPAEGTVLATYGCNRCHDGATPSNPPAPSLAGIGSRLDTDQLLSALYRHPGDGGLDQVTLAELQTLVQHLSENS